MSAATPETYRDVFARLEREEIPYVVVGGVAVVLRGHVRPIADLDVVVNPDLARADLAMRALMALGFVPSIPLPLSAVAVLRMLDPAGREVDLFRQYHVPFAELWNASEELGAGVRVASVEHLLRVKQLLRRPADLQDVEALLSVQKGPR